MKQNRFSPKETKPVMSNPVETLEPGIIFERACQSHDAICNDSEDNKLFSAFIKCGVNPVDGMIVEAGITNNVYNAAGSLFNRQSAYLKDALDSKDSTVFDMASLDVFRSTMTEHFRLLAENAISEATRLANIRFTSMIKGASVEATKILDRMFCSYYMPIDGDGTNPNVFYEAFRTCNIIYGDGGTEYVRRYNKYCTESVPLPALSDLTFYRMCDITSIFTSIITRLECNFNLFKNKLSIGIMEYDDPSIPDVVKAAVYDLIIEKYNICQVSLLESLERVVQFLDDESARIHCAGLPGYISIDPIQLRDNMANENRDMVIDPETGKLLEGSNKR